MSEYLKKYELLTAKGGYLSKKYFTFKDSDLQYQIQTAFPESEWSFARSFLDDKRNRISVSAISLANRIQTELNIMVFPLIIPIAIKGYKEDGQVKFKMIGKKNTNIITSIGHLLLIKEKTSSWLAIYICEMNILQ